MKNPFSYKVTKERKVMIYRGNKLIKIVKGKWSEDFISNQFRWSEEDKQLKLAKITGHYKHGNEKTNSDPYKE